MRVIAQNIGIGDIAHIIDGIVVKCRFQKIIRSQLQSIFTDQLLDFRYFLALFTRKHFILIDFSIIILFAEFGKFDIYA